MYIKLSSTSHVSHEAYNLHMKLLVVRVQPSGSLIVIVHAVAQCELNPKAAALFVCLQTGGSGKQWKTT